MPSQRYRTERAEILIDATLHARWRAVNVCTVVLDLVERKRQFPLWNFRVMSPPFLQARHQTTKNQGSYGFARVSNRACPNAPRRDAPRKATRGQYLPGRPGPGGRKTTISTTGGKKFMSLSPGPHFRRPTHSQSNRFTENSAATVTAPRLNKLAGAGLGHQSSLADASATTISNRNSIKIGISLR